MGQVFEEIPSVLTLEQVVAAYQIEVGTGLVASSYQKIDSSTCAATQFCHVVVALLACGVRLVRPGFSEFRRVCCDAHCMVQRPGLVQFAIGAFRTGHSEVLRHHSIGLLVQITSGFAVVWFDSVLVAFSLVVQQWREVFAAIVEVLFNVLWFSFDLDA